MALNAAIVIEVRQTGNDTNGGGFKTGATGTDWTLQDSPQYSVTDGVTDGTATITSATASFGTDVVGNLVYVQGGTGSVVAGWYEITARNSATSITVDRLTGLTAGTGVTLKIGGAMATPGGASAIGSLVTGNRIWVKYSATPYSITTSTAGAAGPTSLATTIGIFMEGYEQTRGDRTANIPTYQWNASAPGVLTYMAVCVGGSRQAFINMIFDGNNVSNVGGVSVNILRTTAIKCVVKNCSGAGAIGYLLTTGGSTESCQAISCTTGFSGPGYHWGSEAVSCTTGFTGTTISFKCIARLCTNGFSMGNTMQIFINCLADGNTTSGFTGSSQSLLINCLSTNHNGGSGTGYTVGTNVSTLFNCASYNNTTAVSGTPLSNEGLVSLTADPYINKAAADFRPNNMAGGGSLLKAAGLGVYGQSDTVDIGAVQHTESVGGSISMGF